MKKSHIALIMLTAAVVLSICAASTRADSNPPVIEAGWNLVSTPCDITVAEINDKLHLDSFKVYEWVGGRYVSVDTLKRGVGYAVNSDRNMDTAGLCDATGDKDPVSIEFQEGWNLMGNPYHSALAFSDAFKDEADNIADMIFEYKNGRYRPLLKTDKIRVWQGVWVYSYARFNLNYDFECEKLTINLLDPATAVLDIGKSAAFTAMCLMNGAEYDLTASARWTLSPSNVLSASDTKGVFTAAAPGDCNVTASFDDAVSNSVKITVLKPVPVLKSLKLSASKTELLVGETATLTVTGTLSDGATLDMTDQVRYTVSNADVGTIEETVFTAAAAGTTEIGAFAGIIAAEPITIKVIVPAPTLKSVAVSASKTELLIGETSTLTVTGAYSDGSTADLTSEAAFTLTNTKVGKISSAVFTAAAAGSTYITAKVGSLTSASVKINVTKPESAVVMVRLIVVPETIEIHQNAFYQVYAYYSDNGAYDVTREAELIFDSTAGRAEKGVFYPAKIGTFELKAKFKGVTSDAARLNVIQKKLIWLGIYPEAYPPQGVIPGQTIACPDYLMRPTACVFNPLQPLPCPKGLGYMHCYNNSFIPVNATGKYTAMADYNDNSYRYSVEGEIEKWDVQDTSVLNVTEGGIVTAYKTGRTGVRAYMDGVWSEWSWVQVVDDGTKSFLLLEYSNNETIVKVGGKTRVDATYYTRIPQGTPGDPYVVHGDLVNTPIFKSERVTDRASWTVSKSSIGSYEPSTASFTGLAPGVTGIYAEYNGLKSNSAEIEVWKPSEITFCNANKPNEATWTDNLSIAQLDTDCADYGPNQNVTVSFSALLSDNEPRRALDVCLDLFILDADQNIVKTFRNTNCSPTPLSRAVEGYTPVYEYSVVWDRTDNNGQTVPDGKYTAAARFYILYCPVLKLDFRLTN